MNPLQHFQFILALTIPFLLPPRAHADATTRPGSFDSNGVKIAYVEAGDGPSVILIHGLYSSAQMNWEMPGTFNQLAKHYHVIAPDLRGHGHSDKPADEASYGQPMVDDITRLMDHLHIEKAHIVGYSLGGIIVMKFIVDHPDRCVSATLGGMGWLREGSFLQNVFEHMGAQNRGQTPPACVHGIAKLAVTQDQIKSVKLPMHIFVGDHDPCRRLYVEPLQPVRRDWKVTIIPNAGHLNCIVKPEFKDGLETWLNENSK